jgi:hypothetical protein
LKISKGMKKILIIITLLLSNIILAFSQMPLYGDYTNWNWEDQSQSNWQRRMEEKDPSSPDGFKWNFVTPAFSTTAPGLMGDIWAKADFKKSQGWDLVRADFHQSKYPYFILYNKYLGKLRVFLYRPYESSEVFNYFTISLNFKGKKSAILSADNIYKDATDKYLNSTSTGDDILTSIIPIAISKFWACAEFSMFFDNNVIKETDQIFAGSKVDITIYGCTALDVNLTEAIEGTLKGGAIEKKENNEFELKNAQLIKNIKTINGMISEIKDSYKDINDSTSSKWKIDYKATVKPIADGLGDIFKVIGGISNAIGVGFGVYNTVMGILSPTQSSTSVTASTPKTITGKISSQPAITWGQFKVPGANNGSDVNITKPYYDCSMGLINLGTTPKIKVTTPYRRRTANPANQKFCSDWWLSDDVDDLVYVKYKFDDNIDLVVNKMAGVEIVDKKFAIVCKQNVEEIKSMHSFLYQADVCWGPGMTVYVKWNQDIVYNSLNTGKLIMLKNDPSDPKNNLIGSPYLDYEKLKGFTFEAYTNFDVYLGVIVQLKASFSDEPIYVKALYNFDSETPTQCSSITCDQFDLKEQPVFPLSDYYKCDLSHELANKNNSSTHIAGKIIMKPGFSGINGFKAIGKDPYPTGTPLSTNDIPYFCRNTTKSASIEIDNNSDDNDLNSNEIRIYPNPVVDVLNISGLNNPDVSVFDLMGRLILQKPKIDDGIIDLNGVKSGTYVVKLQDKSNCYYHKIVKK